MNALRVSCITIVTIALPCVLLRFVLVPTHRTISCDWFLAPLVQKALEAHPLPRTLGGLPRYIDEALDEIPAVQTIHAHINRYKTMHVTIHGHKPWLMINTQHVLTRDGFILPAYFFNTELLKTLTIINADLTTLEIEAFNADLFTFLKTMPQEILYDAHITWCNKTYITLELPELPNITIIAHYATEFTEKTMQLLTTIAQEKASQKKTKKMSVFADIRFKNQIILSYKKEGAS